MRHSSKPLDALTVKRHREGVLIDAPPHQGLRFSVNKNGTKTWTYRYRTRDKKLRQIKLGDYPAMQLSEARAAFVEQQAIRNTHGDPREFADEQRIVKERHRRNSKKTEFLFSQMVDQYLTEMVEKNRTLKGANEARRLLEKHLKSLAGKRLQDVSPQELHVHILDIRSKTPDTARRFRAELKAAWEYSVSTGKTDIFCPINTHLGGKIKQGRRERVLSDAEVELLLPWMGNYSDAVADALRLTLYLGLRSGEVCALHEQEIAEESDGWWVTIPAKRMKKRHIHRVPLSGTALEIVSSRLGRGYLFLSRGGSYIQQKSLGVEIYSHSGKSKAPVYQNNIICPVKSWAPNDLRKTARTKLAALGCPFEVAESILAHKLPGVSGLYNQYEYKDERRFWLAKLGLYFDGLKK